MPQGRMGFRPPCRILRPRFRHSCLARVGYTSILTAAYEIIPWFQRPLKASIPSSLKKSESSKHRQKTLLSFTGLTSGAGFLAAVPLSRESAKPSLSPRQPRQTPGILEYTLETAPSPRSKSRNPSKHRQKTLLSFTGLPSGADFFAAAPPSRESAITSFPDHSSHACPSKSLIG